MVPELVEGKKINYSLRRLFASEVCGAKKKGEARFLPFDKLRDRKFILVPELAEGYKAIPSLRRLFASEGGGAKKRGEARFLPFDKLRDRKFIIESIW